MVKYVVHAENIRAGGGLVLLKKLNDLLPKTETVFIINSEVQNLIKSNYIVTVGNSLRQRVFARISLDYPDASHLHFGNLLQYFQNRKMSVFISKIVF